MNKLAQKQSINTLKTEPEIVYGTFWFRFFAMMIDTVIMMPFIIAELNNKIRWKSPTIFIIISLLVFLYRPFCEYKYGATLGKMVLKLSVVNDHFEKVNLKQVLLRNIFNIVFTVISLVTTLILFNTQGFENATTLKVLDNLPGEAEFRHSTLWLASILYIVEIVFLLVDKQKRSLHDRIGNTLVIRNVELSA
jgi:uncharacterized RDD family membrane protein YckC